MKNHGSIYCVYTYSFIYVIILYVPVLVYLCKLMGSTFLYLSCLSTWGSLQSQQMIAQLFSFQEHGARTRRILGPSDSGCFSPVKHMWCVQGEVLHRRHRNSPESSRAEHGLRATRSENAFGNLFKDPEMSVRSDLRVQNILADSMDLPCGRHSK